MLLPTIWQYILSFTLLYSALAIILLQHLPKDNTSITLLQKVSHIKEKETMPRQLLSVPLGVVRLGNHLFKYAAGYGIAKDRGAEFCVEQPTFRFTIFKGPFVKQCRTTPDYTIVEKKFGFRDNRFYEPLGKYKHIGIRRYFQCFEYFNQYKSEIQNMFEIKDKVKKKAKQYLQQISKNNDDKLTCFHFRLGDMSWNNEGMTLPEKQYYIKSINMIRKETTQNLFLIISDEPSKASENLSYLKDYATTVVSHGNLHTDFTIMATLCDNIVFSRGTFAWWAA